MISSPNPARRFDVDTLRVIAILLLVPFHTARLYDSEAWHMKDLTAPYWIADFLIRILNIFQMPLLFLLAGMSAAWALERRSGRDFLRERALRLLVPLIFGIFILVAPQVWLERTSPEVPLRMSPIDFDGNFFAFVGNYLSCCYPEANFSWHHLWFLPYLFVYCLPLTVLTRTSGAETLANWIAGASWRLFLPGLVLVGLEMFLRPHFPSTHNLIWDWANHAHYAFLVIFGWWLARNPALEKALQKVRFFSLVAGIALVALWFTTLPKEFGGFALVDISRQARHIIRICAEWCLLLSALAYARSMLAQRTPFVQTFVLLALPFYLFHQTIIVVLGWVWLDWVNAPALKAIVIAGLTTAISLMLAWICAQFRITRFAVGLPVGRKSSAADADP